MQDSDLFIGVEFLKESHVVNENIYSMFDSRLRDIGKVRGAWARWHVHRVVRSSKTKPRRCETSRLIVKQCWSLRLSSLLIVEHGSRRRFVQFKLGAHFP